MKTIQYIFIIISLLYGHLVAEEVKSKLVFDGEFTSAWHTRKDGTTAILYKGKIKWESKDTYGQVWGNLDANSQRISVEPQKDTEYRLFYADSKTPLIMKPQNIVSILQEAMQRRITKAYAIEPVIKINENGHINLSARVFVFHTSLKRNRKGKVLVEQQEKITSSPVVDDAFVMVNIGGQVNKFGRYKLPKNATSKDILNACSGATPFGSIRRIQVVSLGETSIRRFDLRKDIVIPLKNGDAIVVPQKK